MLTDGIHPNLPRPQYEAVDAMRQTLLKKGLKSMRYLKYAMEHPGQPSAAMQFGTLVHDVVLEPEKAIGRYLSVEQADGRTKAGKEAKARQAELEAQGYKPVPADDLAAALAIRQLVREHAECKTIMRDSHAEVAVFWTEPLSGVRCKSLLDIYQPGMCIADIKTCRDATPHGFARASAQFGYHIQAAFYIDSIAQHTGEVIPFAFIAVETEPPFDVVVYPAGDEFIEHGRSEYQRLLTTYAECQRTGVWPGIAGETLELPRWAVPSDNQETELEDF